MADVVRLYRTVSLAEFRDLESSHAFRPGGGAEGKYFWETFRDAGRFGAETAGHYDPDGYRVVAADVPRHVVDGAFRFSTDRFDGIGPALFLGLDDLPRCVVVFLDSP